MTDYQIEAVRTVSDPVEVQRRFGQVYDLLLRLAAEKRSAGGGEVGDPDHQPAVNDADESQRQSESIPYPAAAQVGRKDNE